MAPPSKKLKVDDPSDPPPPPAPEADLSGQRSVFVRSLNYSTTTDSLSAHFSFIAPLKHATVVVDPATKASRGFGFVTFTDPADALKAVQEFNGKLFEGRHIKVEIAQARHRDSGATGSGGTEDTTAKSPKKIAKPPPKVKEPEVKKRNPRLIVRNLPWSVKKPEQLTPLFSKFGKVKEIIIPRKNGAKHGPMAGFAFVTLQKQESAKKAIEAVNGTEIEGRTVAVDWAIEKDEWKQRAADEDENEEGEQGEKEVEDEDPMDIDEALENDDDDGSDSDNSDDDDDDNDLDDSMSDVSEPTSHLPSSNDTVIFIRNLAFTTDEDALFEHFTQSFGPVRYARIVLEPDTGRPRGTAFVSFYNEADYDTCIASAPRNTVQSIPSSGKGGTKQSVLQSESLDDTGKYTLGGRILSVSPAVSKDEAGRLTAVGTASREKVKNEKRRLYLLNEGNITHDNPLYAKLSQADIKMREESYKQRKGFLEKNTSLHLSLVRLSVRNIPRNITEKDLKMLARKAVVEFAKEAKGGKRGAISKEESSRGGIEARDEEANRRAKGKGIVRQAKIVREKSGNGRSMGYGFIEYIGHRWALMGLRWLNGREVAHLPAVAEGEEEKKDKELLDIAPEDKKRRLIVEFALENVQVVQRRKDKEHAAKGRVPGKKGEEDSNPTGRKGQLGHFKDGRLKRKREREEGKVAEGKKEESGDTDKTKQGNPEKWDKQKRAAQIIARKRQKRRMRA
ncbi:Nucleolin [Dactylellina cionopaga]|nr:Nucleolin [Dactylellina cionopaga]